MSERCMCDIRLTPPDASALDCKHILCRECFSVWSAAKTCPRCYIEDALDRLSTSGANEHALDRLVQMFCLKTKELLAAKQNVLPLSSESFCTSALEKSPSTRDDVVHKYKGNDMDSGSPKIKIASTGGRKRKATTGDSSTQVDSDDEMQVPSDARKRQRTTATPDVDCAITRNMDKERVLLRKTEELKTQLDKTYVDWESRETMCRQSEDMTKKAKGISSETAGEARKQADRIKELIADLNNQYIKLAAAKKTIQEFKSKAEEAKLALRKAEKRAIEFEAWGRQTKAHYQDIIRQMEANRPRSGTTTRPSSHAREYLKELPTLRPVQVLDDLDDDEMNLCTPKKRRESAPIIMTPLRKSSNNHVDLP